MRALRRHRTRVWQRRRYWRHRWINKKWSFDEFREEMPRFFGHMRKGHFGCSCYICSRLVHGCRPEIDWTKEEWDWDA